ncbi:hypothetical protein DSECCO2_75840 [anaerobic digester metagenome]
MFSNKQIGILYNRLENTLRIIGGKIIKGEDVPSPNQFLEIFHKQMPFEVASVKPCEISTREWDSIWIIEVKVFFEADFTFRCSLWLCRRFDYRIICNTTVIHFHEEDLDE